MDTTSMTAAVPENRTFCGCRIRLTESLARSAPTRMIDMLTKSPVIYSIRPCPKGWSLSGLLPDSLNPISVITLDAASERLLKPSAMMDTEDASIPAVTLPANNRILRKIPTAPERTP